MTASPVPDPPSTPVNSPAPPPTIVAAFIETSERVWTYDIRLVRLDDLEEVHSLTVTFLANKVQLARVHRAGVRGPQLDWRTEIHTREIERAVGRLQELGAFFRRDDEPPASADERRPE